MAGFVVAVLLGVAATGVRAQVVVDLELILAVDVSGSMDAEEHYVQRRGYIEALVHPDVTNAIRSGPIGRIAITYVEWAGAESQAVLVPWQVVEDEAGARAFAEQLATTPITPIRGTSISGAIAFTTPMFDANGIEGIRRVIDVSGDGANRQGPPVELVRDLALARGIVINGLPIMIRPSGGSVSLARYYQECVVGGPGHFVMPVFNVGQMATAIRRKLVLEIAAITPERPMPTPVQLLLVTCLFQ